MKSMEEYINSVYERYEESEKNHEVYKKVRMTRKRPLATLCGITACLLVACICFVGYGKVNNQHIVDNPVFVDKEERQIVTYTKYIDSNNFLNNEKLQRIIERSDVIALIKGISKDGTIAQIKNNKVFINSTGIFNINKILKGQNLVKENTIKYSILGGKISFSELEKEQTYDWEEWKKINIGQIIIEEKENTYYEQIVERAEILKENKQYLVFLLLEDEENNVYSLCNNVYGIMEYDPVTNKVKNIDTGEFEEFDWSLIRGN